MKISSWLCVLTFTLSSLQFSGCGNVNLDDVVGESEGASKNNVQTKVSIAPPPPTATDTITIASFNIQVFGQSKMAKPEAMKVIVDVCRQFDIVAVQELRSTNQDVIPRFLAMLNADGAKYDYLIGPRQGRSSSQEQYVFIYDSQKIEVLDPGFVVPDEGDTLHRPPVASRFKVRSGGLGEPFTLTLINLHTDPDETKTEVAALAKAYEFVRKNMPGEDDFIMLGDFNVGENKYAEIAQIPNMSWAISGATTNTKGTKSYDNLFFDSVNTSEFTGASGVFDFKTEYNLTMDQALQVSDHFPVWGIFNSQEQPAAAVAGLPATTGAR